jgi:FkbM family methyltransferase
MKLRSLLRPVLGRERAVWRALRSPRLRHLLFRADIDCVIYSLIVSLPRVFFIQIGSHDGRSGDPLWTFRRYGNWRGILVEPVDYVFQRLVQNYSPWRDRFVFENVAIATASNARPFHYFAESADLAAGYDQLGTFDRELLQRHAGHFPGAEARMVNASVNCLTFHDLCAKHDVRALDLLHIDAEGSDSKILEQVDFKQYRPSVLLFEHIHLSEGDRQKTDARLHSAGYVAARISNDTLAVRREALAALPALRSAWQQVASKP